MSPVFPTLAASFSHNDLLPKAAIQRQEKVSEALSAKFQAPDGLPEPSIVPFLPLLSDLLRRNERIRPSLSLLSYHLPKIQSFALIWARGTPRQLLNEMQLHRRVMNSVLNVGIFPNLSGSFFGVEACQNVARVLPERCQKLAKERRILLIFCFAQKCSSF